MRRRSSIGSRARSLAGIVAVTAMTFAAPSSAFAVERQWHVGADFGGSALDVASTMHVGLGLGVDATYGVTDQFNVVGELQSSRLLAATDPSVAHARPSGLSSGALGVTYVLDVLRWVPYGGVLLGGDLLSGGSLDGARALATAQLAVGLDYQLDRTWSVGVAGREHLYADSTYPSFTTVFARVEYAWGW